MIDGYTFHMVSNMPYNPRLRGEQFKWNEDIIGIMAGEPWADTTVVDEEEFEIIISRVALFKKIVGEEETAVSNTEGDAV